MEKKSRIKEFKDSLKKVGPGIITGVSDDDPSGIATYLQAGTVFGLKLLWTALLTYPLMYAIQAMCARIGILSSSGLIGIIHKHYHPILAWLILAFSLPAIILNIAANLASMGAVLHLIFPNIPSIIFCIIITLISCIYIIFCNFSTISNIFKILCIGLLGYFIIPFLVQTDWRAVLHATFIPHFELTKEYIFLLIAIFGTTISPYLFFWQSSYSHEEKKQDPSSNVSAIRRMKLDVNLGMLASNLGMYFIILSAASVLTTHGITHINTVEEAALAFEPLAGEFAFLAFSIGILGVGFLSIPVLAGCLGYMFTECCRSRNGLDKQFFRAPVFYTMIIFSLLAALFINFLGVDPIKSLIWTAFVYGLITPPILFLILLVCNNEKIMGPYVNTFFYNALGIATLLLMSSALVALFAFSI